MRVFAFLVLFFWGLQLSASVWDHDESLQWNKDWQRAYSQWVRNEVGTHFFKELGPEFANLKLDCADAHYALVAYFSRQHGLPFSINQGRVTNLTSKFDKVPSGDSRFIAFIQFIMANYGTVSLVHNDTFSPALNGVVPGDLFMWKTGSGGVFTRHAYIVKNINSNGSFDVLYSTQANAKQRGPMKLKRQYMFSKLPNHSGKDFRRWGFRRMKPAQFSAREQGDIPNSSFEQYELAQSLSRRQFFKLVKNIHQSREESADEVLSRNFNSMCSTLKERVVIVDQALEEKRRRPGQCMDFANFDAHSTPGRNTGIKQNYLSYQADVEDLQQQGRLTLEASPLMIQVSRAIFPEVIQGGATPYDREVLQRKCPIKYGEDAADITNLYDFRNALFEGRVSFNPNDNLYRRWGVARGEKTSCEPFYGYPEE